MAINTGYIEGTSASGAVVVRVYYDASWLANDPTRDPGAAPLIDGPRGYCLDIANTSGSNIKVTLTKPDGTSTTYNVGQGDPVTKGAAKSLTAAQMNSAGFATRGDVQGFGLQ